MEMLKRYMRYTILAAIAGMAMTGCASERQKPKAAMPAGMRVEPMNWWVGMKEPKVQLLLRYENIGETTPRLRDSHGAKITKTIKTDNPNYLFIDLDLSAQETAETIEITFETREGEVVATVPYELKERRKGSAERQGFNSSDAVFLLMPDRFANADTTNDSQPGMLERADRNAPYGRHGGDIAGVIEHLDYIQNLGMTALWMTPVMENDMPEASYHGVHSPSSRRSSR